MATTINWDTQVINVLRADMLLVQSSPSEIRELDIDVFRLELKALEAGVEGMAFLDAHRHNPPVTVGGVTLARVVEIINGYTITFEDGQYAVNLVGANSNIADVTNVNQVSVRSANSAGLTYSKEIENQSFYDSRVFIDTDLGQSGVQFPRGTPGDPVDTYDDAAAIILNRILANRLWLNGNLSLSGYDLSNSDWLGISRDVSGMVLNNVNLLDGTFRNMTFSGNGYGKFELNDSEIGNFSGFEGDLNNVGLGGIVTLPSGASTIPYNIRNSYSMVTGTGVPVIDFNGATGISMQLRGYTGGIELRNYSDASNNISIDLVSGHVVLDSSVTAGTIVIRGTGRLTDNSTGATTVITSGFTPVWSTAEKDATLVALTSIADTITLLQKYEENRSVIDKTAKTLTIYDDDNVTPILVFSLKDSLGVPSVDEVAERVPQ